MQNEVVFWVGTCRKIIKSQNSYSGEQEKVQLRTWKGLPGSISGLPDGVIVQLLHRIHEGAGWHCKPEILWWVHIKIFYGPCDGCVLWPDILLLYCSGKTLCHIGKSRTNRGQSEHLPTVFCVSFTIWGRDTSKTLQPPGLLPEPSWKTAPTPTHPPI